MAPSRVVGALTNSSSNSGVFFQDGQSQAVGNSHLSSSFGNIANSIPGTARSNTVPVSGDVNVGASSLVTDANSALTGGPNLQRSSSINTDSYMRLPASPMSFSSNNISVSGSSVMDGASCIVPQSSHQEAIHPNQQQGASSATSLPASHLAQASFSGSPRIPGAFIEDANSLSQVKKPRLDIKQEDILQQQVMQQLLQRQGPMHLQSHNPQIQALIQQQRLRQQHQKILQSLPPIQRAQLHQQQQLQMRNQLQQQAVQSVPAATRPFDTGVCARRLMQYLYHQRQRPQDNSIAYWRKFVTEYYSPRAKKRWCLSLYDNVGHNGLGAFPQSAMDVWQCDICNSKPGRGFEATFEILPRLNEIKFSGGVVDEQLFLDLPREFRFPSGVMILEYAKAVQDSVYEQIRVIREGQLRITFTPDLKILYWEFCARRHEELLPRRLVAPQVNQLVQVAQKCQSTIAESGPDGISQQDLQNNSNMVLAAGRQLAKSLELQSLNDLGFSKRYIRCLQIAEVVNSMKDLIDFCKERRVGPIEGLKIYSHHANTAKLKMQEMEQTPAIQGLPTDPNKFTGMHRGIGRAVADPAMAMTTYQNMLMRQNAGASPNLEGGISTAGQNPGLTYPGQPALIQRSVMGGFAGGHLQTPQQRTFASPNLQIQNRILNSPQPSLGSPLQQQMIHQLLQEMTASNATGGNNDPRGTGNISLSGGGHPPSRSNSFKSDSSGGFNQRAQEMPQNIHLSEDLVQDITHEFSENGFFNADLDDTICYGWKA